MCFLIMRIIISIIYLFIHQIYDLLQASILFCLYLMMLKADVVCYLNRKQICVNCNLTQFYISSHL